MEGCSNDEKYKIFLVDDDSYSLDLIEMMITSDDSEKYDIRKFTNSPDALSKIIIEKPDVVVLDINMPIMNGFEICQTIKSRPETKNIIVVFVTSYNSEYAKYDSIIRYKADYYISKPFSKEMLVNFIKMIKMAKKGYVPVNRNAAVAGLI